MVDVNGWHINGFYILCHNFPSATPIGVMIFGWENFCSFCLGLNFSSHTCADSPLPPCQIENGHDQLWDNPIHVQVAVWQILNAQCPFEVDLIWYHNPLELQEILLEISSLYTPAENSTTKIKTIYTIRDTPDSTVFAHPGNRTIAKTILIGDNFSTKIRIYDFWNFKVPFFGHDVQKITHIFLVIIVFQVILDWF